VPHSNLTGFLLLDLMDIDNIFWIISYFLKDLSTLTTKTRYEQRDYTSQHAG
jgi:hypothetical protein